jgi:hypothetical protein
MHKDNNMNLDELEILLDSSATPEEVGVVREAFTDAGLTAKVRPSYERRGTGDLPWVVMVSVPLTAFLTAFAAEAGKDAYKGLKRLVRTIWDKRTKTSGPSGSFTIIDIKSGIWVLLDPDIPDDAYSALSELDLDSLQGSGVLKYDKNQEGWVQLP